MTLSVYGQPWKADGQTGLSKQSILNQLLLCWCTTWLDDGVTERHASRHSIALTLFRRGVLICRMELLNRLQSHPTHVLHNDAAKAKERERKRERKRGAEVWGSRFYLHLQPLLHKYPGRHCWHLGPVVPSLHIQNPVPLQRSLTEPKGLQLHSGRTRHTNTHTG